MCLDQEMSVAKNVSSNFQLYEEFMVGGNSEPCQRQNDG